MVGIVRNERIKSKSRFLESSHTKIEKWKLQTRFYWVCSWEIMKSAISFTRLSTGLSGIQFSILNVLESMIPNDQKKYNNSDMKSGRLFMASTQHLTSVVVNIILVKSRSLESNQIKIKKWNCRLGFIESVMILFPLYLCTSIIY